MKRRKPYLMKALTLRPGDPAVRYQLAALDLATGQVGETPEKVWRN